MSQVTVEELNQWIETLMEKVVRPYFQAHFPRQMPKLSAEIGRKYARIVDTRYFDGVPNGQSVHHFVDLTTGNVHKPAGWKAPLSAKKRGVRTNIRANDALEHMDVHGCRYLR